MRIHRGFHPSVDDRIKRMHDQKLAMPFRGAVFAKVFAPDANSERVNVETVTGETKSAFSYPFASANAWIRGQPEETTTMISLIGGDTKDIQPVGYYDPTKAALAETYSTLTRGARQNPASPIPNRTLAYRVLSPGEIDMGSRYAQTFMGMRDVHQSRGGLSHQTMTSLYTRMETPLLYVEGAAHQVQANLNDEMRFGTVRRAVPNVSSATMPSLVRGPLIVGAAAADPTAAVQPPFAKEWSVLLDWPGEPGKLIDHRQGIVVEDDGRLAFMSQTQKRLRSRHRWFTTAGFAGGIQFTSNEIDEAGNILFETSQDATSGIAMSVPTGNIQIKVGGDNLGGQVGGRFNVTASHDMQFNTAQRYSLVADSGFRINTPQRGEIKADVGLGIKSDGIINIDARPPQGITLGNRDKTKYPVLVAHPDYLSTLGSYYSAHTAYAGAAQAYAAAANAAWTAVGSVLGIIDPSGVLLGLCTSASAAAQSMSGAAQTLNQALGQHQPKLTRMPAGFISEKTVSM